MVWLILSWSSVESAITSRETLLHRTDHRQLLAACREVMARRHEYAARIDPKDPQLPEMIRQLRPAYIEASRESLMMELHGGFDHYGVWAYAEGSEQEGHGMGTKLIDGLWYYTE